MLAKGFHDVGDDAGEGLGASLQAASGTPNGKVEGEYEDDLGKVATGYAKIKDEKWGCLEANRIPEEGGDVEELHNKSRQRLDGRALTEDVRYTVFPSSTEVAGVRPKSSRIIPSDMSPVRRGIVYLGREESPVCASTVSEQQKVPGA